MMRDTLQYFWWMVEGMLTSIVPAIRVLWARKLGREIHGFAVTVWVEKFMLEQRPIERQIPNRSKEEDLPWHNLLYYIYTRTFYLLGLCVDSLQKFGVASSRDKIGNYSNVMTNLFQVDDKNADALINR
jgi:hypothetical protein